MKNYYYDSKEVATVLCELASKKDTEKDTETIKDVEEALYQLKAISENEYNADYYRTFWDVLQKITEINY